jgi:dienelactone hydrolase
MRAARRLQVLAAAMLACATALAQDVLAPPADAVAEGIPPIAAAVAQRLQPYAEFVPHGLVAWHPARREMLVQRRGEAATQLHVVTEPGLRPVRLAELPQAIVAEWNRVGEPTPAAARAVARLEAERHVDISVSPDGKRLAYVQVANPMETHLWVMDVASGKRQRVTRPAKDDPVSYRLPRFSPDGRALFATSDRGSEWRRLVRIPLPGGAERVLTAHLQYDIDDFEISADAGRIAFTANERGSHSLRFLDLKSLEEQPRPPLFNGVISGLAWRPKSSEVGFQLAGARAAGDVFSYDVGGNKLARWTNGNSTRVNVSQFAEPRIVKWPGAGGRDIVGFLYAPPEKFRGKRPVFVDFREGPGSQARAGFIGDRNFLVGELGIMVLHPNVRGASGFGKSFLRLGQGPRRDQSARDLAAMLDWIRAQPDLDAGKVLVAGVGAGGTMALVAAAEAGDRIAGALAVLPAAVPANAGRITRPVFVVAGRSQPQRDSLRALTAAAKSRGAATWSLEVENDGAALARKADADYLSAATVEFAQKVLLN